MGIVTVGSIFLSSIGWLINLVMGCIFIIIGFFFYLRGRAFNQFVATTTRDVLANLFLQRYLRLEIVLAVCVFLIGGFLLAASMYRVFGEGLAVFG